MHAGDDMPDACEHGLVPSPEPMAFAHDHGGEGGTMWGSGAASGTALDVGCSSANVFAIDGSDGSVTDFSVDWDGDVDGFFLQQHQQEGGHTGCATPRINMLLRNMSVERPASIMCTEDAAGMPNGTFSDPEVEENVRLQAINLLLECVEPLQLASSKVEAWNAQAAALTLQSCSGPVPSFPHWC